MTTLEHLQNIHQVFIESLNGTDPQDLEGESADFFQNLTEEISKKVSQKALEEQYFAIQDVCRVYLLPILGLLGIVINVQALVVLYQKRIKTHGSIAWLFAFLNLSDM